MRAPPRAPGGGRVRGHTVLSPSETCLSPTRGLTPTRDRLLPRWSPRGTGGPVSEKTLRLLPTKEPTLEAWNDP